MSYREARQWESFLRTNGPLNLARRVEMAIARLCWVTQAVQGGKLTAEDFMPDYSADDEPEQEATLEQFAAILSMARVK